MTELKAALALLALEKGHRQQTETEQYDTEKKLVTMLGAMSQYMKCDESQKTQKVDALLHAGGLDALLSVVEERRPFSVAKLLSLMALSTLAERAYDEFDWDTLEVVLLPRFIPAVVHLIVLSKTLSMMSTCVLATWTRAGLEH